MSSSLNMDKLPIEIQERIWSYVDDISLIPDGLTEHFWIKYALRNSLYRVMFASWEKSCKIIKDFDRLKKKRKILAVLDWKHVYVGTLADITVNKSSAKYNMKKEVIAAAGRTGLCMLVEPANMEDESYLDISPRGSFIKDYYTGEFTSDTTWKDHRENDRILNGTGVTAWYHDYHYNMNNILYKIVRDVFKMYNVQYDLIGRNSENENEYIAYNDYAENATELDNDKYISEYGRQLPWLCLSLVYTKDPLVFEKPHLIEMLYKENNICTVKDWHGNLTAFIVCIPTWEEFRSLLCFDEELCYLISNKGNIYFEECEIYCNYVKYVFRQKMTV